MADHPTPQLLSHYEACRQHCALVPAVSRTHLMLSGSDALSFLHKFCTADLEKLEAGQGSEAFITSVQGKTLAYVSVLVQVDSLHLMTAREQAAVIHEHLDRYVIREDVNFQDRSSELASSMLIGPGASGVLEELLAREVPGQPLHHCQTHWRGEPLQLVSLPEPLKGCWLLAEDSTLKELHKSLTQTGVALADQQLWECLRVEAGLPEFALDVNESNLPQEVNRDSQAISFTKGCYLGQETVARIDAIGHVNRLLTGLRLPAESDLAAGSVITVEQRTVAQITTVSYSPRLDAPLALAYVRRDSAQPGNSIGEGSQAATVIELPLV